MPLLRRRSVVLAKVETTYGQDAAPDASNGILCSNPEVRPMADTLVRDFVRETLSPLEHVIGAKYVEVSFETEVRGSGDNSSATAILPEVDPLLRACGFAATTGDDGAGNYYVTYTPKSSDFESVTLYVYFDGVLHKVTGCYGTFTLTLAANQFGRFAWTFRGLWNDVVDAAMVSPTYDATKPPVVSNLQLKLDEFQPALESFTFELNNTLANRMDVNAPEAIRGIMITGRESSGTINPEMETVATYDFFGIWKNATSKSLTAVLGSELGNKITITAPKVQEKSLTYGDREGVLTLEIPLNFATTSADDEISIKFE